MREGEGRWGGPSRHLQHARPLRPYWKPTTGFPRNTRARVLAVLDAPDGSPERAAGWIPASVAAVQVGVHLSTLGRWIDAGKIHSRKAAGERSTLVHLAEVSAYAAAHPNKRRGTAPGGGDE